MEKKEKVRERYLESKEKSIIRDYYSKELNKGKTYRAVSLDKIASFIIIFLVFNIILLVFTESIGFSIIISLLLVLMINKGFITVTNKKTNEKIHGINDELKSDRVAREIAQMNREEFINYSKELLEKYYLSEFIYGDDGVDLIGDINKKTYAVKCIKSTVEDKIIRKKVNDFHNYINYLEYDEGIIITNGYFQKEIKAETSLILFDFDDLKEILKSIGGYPSDEEISNYIKYKHDDNKKNFKSQLREFNIRKVIRLYLSSIMLYIISFFVAYRIYYRILSVVTFSIATIISGMKIVENINKNTKKPLQK